MFPFFPWWRVGNGTPGSGPTGSTGQTEQEHQCTCTLILEATREVVLEAELVHLIHPRCPEIRESRSAEHNQRSVQVANPYDTSIAQTGPAASASAQRGWMILFVREIIGDDPHPERRSSSLEILECYGCVVVDVCRSQAKTLCNNPYTLEYEWSVVKGCHHTGGRYDGDNTHSLWL
ncbi:hypothetical protein BC826DRAFT_1165230 [Russula brevipes]|nr:hypothetical protein BC826DRAFT_1165230 [Russula brevipes]